MSKIMRRTVAVLLCAVFLLIPFSAFAVTDDDPMPPRSSGVKRAAVTAQETFTHDSRFQSGYAIYDVLDVSRHNGEINWTLVAASGIRYVLIRAGYRGYTEGSLNLDERFQENVNGALAASINVGVYFYSQAISVAEAQEEAQFTLNAIKGMNIALPVVFDFEYAEKAGGYIGRLYEAKLTKSQVTDMCNAFCDKVSSEGYTGMVYGNVYSLTNLMNASDLRYGVWLAAYRSAANYSGAYEMWQYTSTGSVLGITGDVDKSYWYVKDPNGGSGTGTGTGNGTGSDTTVLSLSKTVLVMNKGESSVLTYVVSSDAVNNLYGNGTPGDVAFSSSNTSVATVDAAGKVTAVGKGTAVITATVKIEVATKDAIVPHSHTASCTVSVSDSTGSGTPSTETPSTETPSGKTPSTETPSTDLPSGEGGTGGSSSSSDILQMLSDLFKLIVAFFNTIMKMFN